MKIKTLTSCFFLAFAISSCIQDEALNSEAAIDGCTGADVQLANINANEKIVYRKELLSNPTIAETEIPETSTTLVKQAIHVHLP